MKRLFNSFSLLSGLLFFVLIFVSGCGRKGDPVPIIPPQEKAAEKSSDDNQKGSVPNVIKIESDGVKDAQIPPPTGLTAVYTESSIVITWDEVRGRGVKAYNIYRSAGGAYELIGRAGMNAFTDKNIESGRKYHYKVSAIADSEGNISKEIEVSTKPRE